jgi:beta propeller repeat protein
VWADWINKSYPYDPDFEIYVYDLSTKKTTFIPTGGCAQNLSIYGDKIVWTEHPRGDEGIYLYDLSTKKKTKITSFFDGDCAGIYANKLVYEDYNDNGQIAIYMYDLSTEKTTQITTNASIQQAPKIYGNTIVWQDNRNGNWDIYAYDLITHQQIHTTDKSDQVEPAMYGNKVVWTDYRNGKPDIYMGTISYLPVASFTASPTTGRHPLNVQFTDKSTDGYYWYWNFGDKSTSTLKSPIHRYTKAGKYTVSLKVTNAAGSSTKTMTITVK